MKKKLHSGNRIFGCTVFLMLAMFNLDLLGQAPIVIQGKLWFHVLDESAIPLDDSTANANLNKTLAKYKIASITPVFSFAKTQFLRDTYEITCDCNQEELLNDLTTNHQNLVSDVVNVYEPQFIYDPTDYFWSLQQYGSNDWMWYIESMQANMAWDLTKGNTCVKVAFSDGGVDINHPDLVGKVYPPYDFYTGGSLVGSGFNYEHGTHIAGILAAETTEEGNNAVGQSLSVGFNSKVMASKAAGLQSMLYASSVLNADILSVSWYNSCEPSGYDLLVEKEINDNGTLIVRGAGNMLTNFTNHCGGGGLYPFSGFEDERTLVVSASWKDGRHAANIDWNNDGEPDLVTHNHNAAVDICAPSYSILSLNATANNGVVKPWPYGTMGGTSQSAPLIAATAALMKSVNPCLNNVDIADIIESTALPLVDADDYTGQVGSGRINSYAAVFASLTYGTINPIINNTSWDDDEKFIKTDVIVESGVLTITGNVHFSNESRLIIKPGAKVVVDGGTLTASKCSCSDELFWPGIEVWGQSNERQLAHLQGSLELKNGAVIENAVCAVRLGHLESNDPWIYDWNKNGGIIKTSGNTVFRNNKKDIEFLAYQNYTTVNGQFQLRKNISSFLDTEFLVNEVLPGVQDLKERVSLYDVDGISFNSCNFHIEGDAISNYSIQNRGIGIYSLVSSFNIKGKCLLSIPNGSECDPGYLTAETLGEPGSNISPSRFSNFLTGVRSIGGDGFATTSISETIFDGNEMGLFLKATEQASIKRNRFIINEQINSIAFGVDLIGCTGYTVERNIFEGIGDNTELNTGIWLTDSDDESNLIYLNDFINLYAGSIAQGIQVDEKNDYQGLEMLCGLYENCKYNLAVVKYLEQSGKIALRQGDMANNNYDETAPAGNLFTQTNWGSDATTTDYYICPDPECDPIIYEHHNESSIWPVLPIYIDPLQVENSPNGVYFTSRNNACPVGKGVIGTPQELKDLFLLRKLQVDSMTVALNSLIDGGNTNTVLSFVNDLNNSSATLRLNLLPLTPFLSDEVLSALILHEPNLNPWHLSELLISCSPLKPTIYEKIKLSNQLSDFLFDLVSAYQSGTNCLATRQTEIKTAQLEKSIALNSYIRTRIIEDDENYYLEDVNEILTGDDIKKEIRKKVAILRQENKFNDAISLLSTYNEDNENEVWREYAEVLLSIDVAGGFHATTNEQIETLESLVTTKKFGYQHAAALLEIITEQKPEEEYNLPYGNGKSLLSQSITGDLRRPSLVGVYPIPAINDFYITYLLPAERRSAFINIYDLQGKLIRSDNITGGSGFLNLNTSEFAAGNYLFELYLNGQRVGTDKFQIIK